jgi:hypothetical protein
MGRRETRAFEMRHADLRQAALLKLALVSLGDDVLALASGTEISEDVLHAAVWDKEGSKDTEEIQQLLSTLRETLEKLECRALLFIASESHLRTHVDQELAGDG